MSEIMKMARLGEPFAGETIIDSHCHLGGSLAASITRNSIGEIIKNMDRIGIKTACVCTSSIGSFGDENLHNREVAEACANYPERLYGYVTLNTNYRERVLENYVSNEAAGLKIGIKLHVYGQKPYLITDDFLMPVYEAVNKKRGIVLNHDFGGAAQLEVLLKSFPEISFIAGHLGEGFIEYVPLVNKYDNLYVSTCATLRYDEVRLFCARIGSEKILMGSDFALMDPAFGFGPVVYAKISDGEKRNILGLNMERILNRVYFSLPE